MDREGKHPPSNPLAGEMADKCKWSLSGGYRDDGDDGDGVADGSAFSQRLGDLSFRGCRFSISGPVSIQAEMK